MEEMLQCMQSYIREYQKGQPLLRAGCQIDAIGLVLSGSVNIEQNDVWGRQTILDNVSAGELFAETYACVRGEPLMVDVTAAEDTSVLFLNIDRVLQTCPSSCAHHSLLIRNLLSAMAQKNLGMTRKISLLTPHSLRERLLSYLSLQAVRQGKYTFDIPFNRQQLADYLCVDRSAMSSELGKMKREGLLSFHKNTFELYRSFKTL